MLNAFLLRWRATDYHLSPLTFCTLLEVLVQWCGVRHQERKKEKHGVRVRTRRKGKRNRERKAAGLKKCAHMVKSEFPQMGASVLVFAPPSEFNLRSSLRASSLSTFCKYFWRCYGNGTVALSFIWRAFIHLTIRFSEVNFGLSWYQFKVGSHNRCSELNDYSDFSM